MDKKMGLYSFLLLALLGSVMAWATWFEHVHGSAHAGFTFYNSMWFTLLWVLTATVGCYYIVTRELHKRLSVFLLHASFLLILTGALVTRLTGKTGQVHLRENQQVAHFLDEGTGYRMVFPFTLSLKSFEIEYYPGTNSPADYISIVELTDVKTGERFERKISMNNILRYKGYRFYQSSFDEDWQGSVVSVNNDTWGILISYAGYFLMFLSMLWVLFDKRERFRFLLRKMAQKTILVVLLLGSTTDLPGFQNPAGLGENADLPGLKNPAGHENPAGLGSICVEYQGRISPIQTLANDFTRKLTGKTRYQSFSGEQVFWGWLFFPENWQHVPMFELKSKELIRMAGVKNNYACFSDFIDNDGNNKLAPYYRQMYSSNQPEGWLKEAVKLNDKFHLVEMLQNGSLLKIFPMQDQNGKLQWYSPDMDIPAQPDSMENVFAQHFFPLYYEALTQNDAVTADWYADKLLLFQQKKAGDTLPSATRLKMEQIYNRIQIFSLLFKVCLTVGFLGLFLRFLITLRFIRNDGLSQRARGGGMELSRKAGQFHPTSFFKKTKRHSERREESLIYIVLWIVFTGATFGLGLRTFIGGRLPVSNSYETMLLLAWFSLLTGILARRYSFLIVVFSFLLSGFTLLVAHISSMNPQITPLVPVLQSPLLSIHVLTIMVAYGLCGFMALNSLSALIVWIFGSKKTDRKAYIERMKETSELFMYPASFLMGAGIFIGAIWANQSWGRYWGWDPKEVWALITFLLMGFSFHDKALAWFRKPIFYHIFVLIIFLAVLMTYFGVNYILGGKHSYAG